MKYKILIIIALTVMLASCKTSKHKKDNAQPPVPTETQGQPNMSTNADGTTSMLQENLTAKVFVTINMKGKSVSTRGTLRMHWNDVIQIALLDPFLGVMEAGRLEISSDNILLIDRINKQYVRTTYNEINELAQSPVKLQFADIQNLFWREAMRTDTNEFSYEIDKKRGVSIKLALSDKGSIDKWETHSTPSSSYRQVSPQELLQSLLNNK